MFLCMSYEIVICEDCSVLWFAESCTMCIACAVQRVVLPSTCVEFYFSCICIFSISVCVVSNASACNDECFGVMVGEYSGV